MTTNYVERNAQQLGLEILSDTPVLSVSGGRQVGKSTLVRKLIEGRPAQLVNLDDSSALLSASHDPDGFVRSFPEGTLAIDEIQRVPELFRALKGALEEDRRPGRFIITGSSNLLNLQGAEESLAGRAETLWLRGLSRGEREGRVEDFADFAWNLTNQAPQLAKPNEYSRSDYLRMLTEPSFPEITESTERRRDRWVEAYVERVLTKDAQSLFGIKFPDRLAALLETIATTGMAEFVAARYAEGLDIPARSIPSYLKALKSVFLVDHIPAWGTNLGKRAISKPKVFVADTGLAASMTGVNAQALEDDIASALTGGLMESFVAAELLKQRTWSKVNYRLFHFRSSVGQEVDLILENRGREIVGVEVKAGVSIGARALKGLKFLKETAGARFRAGIVLYSGTEIYPMGDKLWAMPISTLWRG